MKYTPKFANPTKGINKQYTIKKGDNLSAIAKQNGTTVAALMALNPNIKDANKILAGDTLNLAKPTLVKKATPTKETKVETVGALDTPSPLSNGILNVKGWKGKGKVAANMRLNIMLDENNNVLDDFTRVEPEMAQPIVRSFKKPVNAPAFPKFQQGGTIALTDEQKQELFPFFAYVYSQQLNPDKYGSAKSMEEWTSLIQESEEDINTIVKAAGELSDEDWTTINNQYMESQQEAPKEGMQFAAKGGKLKQSAIAIKSKGGKACSCGCKMLLSKEAGGKLKSTCACKCGGKMKKKKITKAQEGTKIPDSTAWKNRTFAKFNTKGLEAEKNRLAKMTTPNSVSPVIKQKVEMITRELSKRKASKVKKEKEI